jgi:hypothetical protein
LPSYSNNLSTPYTFYINAEVYPGEPADPGGAEPVLRAAAGGGAVSGPGAGGAVRPRVGGGRAGSPPALGRPARPDQGGRGRRHHGRLPGKDPDL